MEAYALEAMTPAPIRWSGGIEMMTEQKVFINNYSKASFTCPNCKKRKLLNVSGYRNIREEVKITHRCSCGHTYTLLLERRRFPRKNVRLTGAYVWNERRRKMMIRDMSRGGVRIELKQRERFKIGDKLFIEFSLDDTRRTLIQKEVIVRNIRGPYIGAEFCAPIIETSADRASTKAIASYMLRG